MVCACGDGGHIVVQAHNRNRCSMIKRAAITQLAIPVAAPALHAAVVQQRARVVIADGYRAHTAGESNNIYRCIGIVIGVIAQLAKAIRAPAFDAAIVEQGAIVCAAHSQRHNAAQTLHIHWH